MMENAYLTLPTCWEDIVVLVLAILDSEKVENTQVGQIGPHTSKTGLIVEL
jgi:hypothetical protein